MRLEEAIKQKTPFQSPYQRAVVNLIYTHNWIMGLQKEFFKPYDITMQQYNVLRILRGQFPQPISTSDIRERMLDRMSDVSRIVDRLVKKDLVARKPCATDKRLVDLIITDQGLDLLKTVDSVLAEDKYLSGLDAEEIMQLNELLDKARQCGK